MTLKTYEIIDLTDQYVYKGISKFRRHKIEAVSPMKAAKTLFPNFKPKIDKDGMGSILVFGEIKMNDKMLQVSHTYNLFPLEEVAV